ncbi:Antitoxin component YwqK of the YwqJK toxin-antitoxin module [Ekhidna lutea]|uniref:Antitoxin component YwqK of the YwqJK toxin-antitoxin module n=1 Tax=Ekhidna lutea TaxID=447679 RepID=A0A239J1B6_EKHLU|nr:hypothetical protein [Ekhidna lutea]SNS99599.1 Antitoxin component YwqK of the YwqJK toxin-antitoxin module [Ekhidna lutea]
MKQVGTIGLLVWMMVGCIHSKEEINPLVEEIAYDIPKINILATNPDITKKQNGDVFYHDLPFSGYLVERYPNDSLSLKIGFYDGKQNGVMTSYYENGSIRYIRPYLNGEKHGKHVGFHKNGTKAFEYHFVDGFSEGNHKEWYDNRQPATDMNYVNGKEFGRQQAWRPDGKVRSNYIVRENGRRYGLMGIKRCTKLDGVTQSVDPYKGEEQ